MVDLKEFDKPNFQNSTPRLDKPSNYLVNKARKDDVNGYSNLRKSLTSATVYIGGLSFNTTEEQLFELFSKVGEVDQIKMGLDKLKLTPTGFCFIIFKKPQSALNATKFLNKMKINGKPMDVDLDPGFEEGRQFGRGLDGGQRVHHTQRNNYGGRRGYRNNNYGGGYRRGGGGYRGRGRGGYRERNNNNRFRQYDQDQQQQQQPQFQQPNEFGAPPQQYQQPQQSFYMPPGIQQSGFNPVIPPYQQQPPQQQYGGDLYSAPPPRNDFQYGQQQQPPPQFNNEQGSGYIHPSRQQQVPLDEYNPSDPYGRNAGAGGPPHMFNGGGDLPPHMQ
ncbi:unnamed protein product [Ambrosiozyma monospora]|uniref:Unnamed protein product n=1 Tax=Ambrosiozyma monospora TaxID=43982 RepID=A0A9W6YRX3_AMBMO|nr:unnamed protein product [Ambrosiozyma monospora]